MKVTCAHCGAMNIGVQDHCLICNGPLTTRDPEGRVSPAKLGQKNFCPACNAVILPGTQFCRKCGASQETATPPSLKVPVCPSCGTETIPGTLFCRKCGTRLS